MLIEHTQVLIVGASVAGVEVAKQLARRDPAVKTTIVSSERRDPYDKPPLSKQMITDPHGGFRPLIVGEPAFDLVRADRVTTVDYRARVATLASGAQRSYDTIVLATGAEARVPEWAANADVITLRRAEDAAALHDRARHSRTAIIVGGGLVGTEVASALRGHGHEVAIVHSSGLLGDRALGVELAQELTRLHTSHGTTVVTGTTVTSARSAADGTHVTLSDGRTLAADIVVLAVGARPESGIASAAGVTGRDHPIRCDPIGRVVGLEHAYALGDVSAWEDPVTGVSTAHQHWTNALEQAHVVAAAILGEGVDAHRASGYVWTDQYGERFEKVGEVTAPARHTRLVTRGVELHAYTDHHGHIIGLAARSGGRAFTSLRRRMRTGPPLPLAELPAA